MPPVTFDFVDVFGKISGLSRRHERIYEENPEFEENFDLIKDREEYLEEFKKRFPVVMDNELTREQKKEFIKILKDTSEEDFIEESNKMGDQLDLSDDEKRVFIELLFIMREQKGTMANFMEDLEDLIIDIKKSAHSVVIAINEFIEENEPLKYAAFTTLLIPSAALLFFIVLILVKEDGQDEIRRKLDDVI